MSRAVRLTVGLTLAGVAACSGGGSKTALPPLTQGSTPTGTAHFTLTIPNRTTASGNRRAKYVSASTQAVLFTVNPGNLQAKLNLTSSDCAANAAGTAKVCILAVPAPIGTDTFAMVAYDQPFNADGTQPSGTNALSAASNFTATIAEGQSNVTIPLIAGGIPHTLAVSFSGASATTVVGGNSSSIPLTVTVYDADNNIIVAPGAFVDASGNPASVTLTSLVATTGFAYAVTPSGSTVAGAAGSTITLSQPDDRAELVYNGTAYVPPFDQISHTLPSNFDGTSTSTQLNLGWRFTPPFSPTFLLAPPASISSTIGHRGIVIADSAGHVGFVGDVTSSCGIPSAGVGSVTHIGGVTFNSGVADAHVYLWVSDSAQPLGVGFDAINVSSIIANSCTLSGNAAAQYPGTPLGTAAAGNSAYAVVSTSADFIEDFSLPGLTSPTAGVIDGGASFGTQAVAVAPNGSNGYVQFGSKKRVDVIPFLSVNGTQATLAGMLDSYPAGLAVDTNGNVYADDTTSATYGTNGGIDVFTSNLTLSSQLHLASPLQQSGPTGALQNIAIGPFGTSSAVYAVTAAGIEVFELPLAPVVAAPFITLPTPATPVSIVTVADGREWVLLSDGSIDALPPN